MPRNKPPKKPAGVRNMVIDIKVDIEQLGTVASFMTTLGEGLDPVKFVFIFRAGTTGDQATKAVVRRLPRIIPELMLITVLCRHPVQRYAATGIMLGTLLSRHRIQSNSVTENAVYRKVTSG